VVFSSRFICFQTLKGGGDANEVTLVSDLVEVPIKAQKTGGLADPP